MNALDVQSTGDRDLRRTLLADATVKTLIERLETEQADTPPRVRRQLLATSLKLTPTMMPDVHATVQHCRERLGVEIPLEIYLYPSATFNAACVKPEDGRLFILLSSSLLEAFTEGERRFVIGHELGHHLYGHHDIPVGYLLGGQPRPGPGLALRLYAWSRYAEISSDRAGALCVDEADDVARSLFRLASGLHRPLGDLRIDEFADQLDLIGDEGVPGAGAPRSDWFSTHPFSPLRLKALQLFYASEFALAGGTPAAHLEAGVQELMSLMEPGYLEERSEEAELARRLLLAGAVAVAAACGGIADTEKAAFEEFFGEGSFKDSFDIDKIVASLDERIAEAAAKVSHPRRIQVMRDLCVIAAADGRVSAEEQQALEHVAAGLEVPREVLGCGVVGACHHA